MRRILILVAVFVLIFAVNVQAEKRSEIKYGSSNGDYWVDLSYVNLSDTNLVFKVNYSSQDIFPGLIKKVDILGGYSFGVENRLTDKLSTTTILAGVAIGQEANGFTLNCISKTYLLDRLYLNGNGEMVMWNEDQTPTFLTIDSLIGFDINDKLSLKSGIRWIQSTEQGQVGPTFAVETYF